MSAVQEVRTDETTSRFGPSSAAFVDQAISHLQEKIAADIREKMASDLRAYLQAEMQNAQVRIEAIEGEIGSMMEDFSIPLEKVIKKRAEKAELNAFIKGLEFAVDGLNSSVRP